jgi:site-specific DNA recombinase
VGAGAGVRDGRFAKKAKHGKDDFAFSGLIACHACGCAVVGEIKKERYIYYHCTGYADKCRGSPPPAADALFVRRCWSSNSPTCSADSNSTTRCWNAGMVCEALHASHVEERREHEEAIKRHRAEYDQLQNRINAMYVEMSSRSHSWRTMSARRRTSASEEKSAGKKAAEPRWAARVSLSSCQRWFRW